MYGTFNREVEVSLLNDNRYQAILEALTRSTKDKTQLPGPTLLHPDYLSLLSGAAPQPSHNNIFSLLANSQAALLPPPTKKSLALKDQLIEETTKIFSQNWETRDG